jgi:hypothetical protein
MSARVSHKHFVILTLILVAQANNENFQQFPLMAYVCCQKCAAPHPFVQKSKEKEMLKLPIHIR